MPFVLVLVVPDSALANEFVDAFTTRLLLATVITSIVWIATALLSKPEEEAVLRAFVQKIKPDIGWKRFGGESSGKFTGNIISVFVGSIGVYSALFSIGNLVYGNYLLFSILLAVFVSCVFIILRLWRKS